MEYLSLSEKFTVDHDTIYINQTHREGDDTVFGWVGFPLAMIMLGTGLIVNVLLIIATRNSPRLKAPIFQLLFAIAFADILLLVAFGLPEIANRIKDRQWVFGSKGCTMLVFLQFLPTHVTSCLLVVCCWERFYAVCRPHSAMWITSRKMSGIIAITWLINGGILAPLIAMTKEIMIKYPQNEKTGEVPTAYSCHLQMPADVERIYFTVMGGMFYGITAIVSVAFLACTICKARKIDLEDYYVKDDFKNHILKCIAAITVITIVFSLPYRYIYFKNLHLTAAETEPVDSSFIVLLGTVMVIFGGAIKPIVYITLSSQFRKSVFRALKCCKSDDHDFEQTHGYKMTDQLNTSEGPLLP